VSGDLDTRVAALKEAAELAAGRLDADAVDRARAVVDKAGARVGLGLETTVIALAGPTGAGKSQLFNALTGSDLAAVGRRRPMTSVAQAAVWGDGADALLNWLEIQRRHRLADGDFDGLVLLDLPDFDSVEAAHRLEVDRVVALADLVLWIVDPQKYADAALHDRYLRPLASHEAAMAVVLNQADLLPAADVASWRKDLERLLEEDGMREIRLVTVSARTGEGLPELRKLLQERVASREAAAARLAADVDAAAEALAATCDGAAAGVAREDRQRLVAALEDAAGVPTIVRAVTDAHRRRGALATGWPFVRWVRRLRPDPLRRLRLPETPQPATRTSLPPPTDVQQAQVATAARRLADRAVGELPPPWPRLVRDAALGAEDRVADRLDRAVGSTDLHVSRPRWWGVAGFLQRVLAAVVAAGALWLFLLFVLGYLRVEEVVPLPEIRGIPIPTWLVLGGIAVGIVLALLARSVNRGGARRRARRAARSLRGEVERVAQELVISPMEEELSAHTQLCKALDAARYAARRAWRRRTAARDLLTGRPN
jgi:GTP-binding protein EngB required for normal cell division